MTNIATMPAKDSRPPDIPVPTTLETLVSKRVQPSIDAVEEHTQWPLLSRLPLRLTASIPLPRFRVRDLLALEPGQVVTSLWSSTDDVPLRVGMVHMSWCEFEVVEKRMAVRLTRLA